MAHVLIVEDDRILRKRIAKAIADRGDDVTVHEADNAEEAINFDQEIEVKSFPNPFRNNSTIRFRSEGEWVKLSIFNNLGNEIRVLANRRLPAGQHDIKFEAHGLPAGNYYFRLQLDGRQKTKKMLKL